MTATVHRWTCDRLDDAVERQIDRVAGQADVAGVAAMPDVHQCRTVPDGIAVATRRIVYPDLVGAGPVMSRSAVGKRFTARDLEPRMRGNVFRREWADRLCDEAPQAYRDLHEVMQAQRDLVRTTAVLVPILNDKRP